VLGTKTPAAVPLEKALKLYAKLIADKTSGGYTPDQSGVAYVDTPLAGRSSGWSPALLEPLDAFPESLDHLLDDSTWLACEKMDGERRGIEVTPTGVVGMNRRGLYVPVPAPWVRALSQLPVGTFLDGEHVADRFHCFDILQLGSSNLRPQGYASRVAALHSSFLAVAADESSLVSLVPVVAGEKAKRALLASVESSGGEGLVLRNRDSAYVPGRCPSARKFKFVESATCLVAGINDGRRSVRLSLLDGETWRDVGSVTVPANHDVPARGSTVEVRYMHLFEQGSLYQPVYVGARTDIPVEECVLEQVTRIRTKSGREALAA
jgi:bifunctional non-homologous end joining protein LigD